MVHSFNHNINCLQDEWSSTPSWTWWLKSTKHWVVSRYDPASLPWTFIPHLTEMPALRSHYQLPPPSKPLTGKSSVPLSAKNWVSGRWHMWWCPNIGQKISCLNYFFHLLQFKDFSPLFLTFSLACLLNGLVGLLYYSTHKGQISLSL